MTKTFMVKITTKKGEPMPDLLRIESALFDTGKSWDSIKLVEVSEVKPVRNKRLLKCGTKVKIVGAKLARKGEIGIVVAVDPTAKGLPYKVRFPQWCGEEGHYGTNEVRKVK